MYRSAGKVFLIFLLASQAGVPAIAQCPDITVSCGDFLTGQSTAGYGADYNGSWDCSGNNAITTDGPDIVYAITPSVDGEVCVTMNNVNTTASLVELIVFTGCPPPPGTAPYDYGCYQYFQYDVLLDAFSSNLTNTACFGVTAGTTYYIMVTTQVAGVSVSYDIGFDCQATGISLDTDCDATNDPDQNGLYTTINGILEPCIDQTFPSTVTICHTVYLQNPGWEWLKYVTVDPGPCITSVSNPTPGPGDGGFYDCCSFLFTCIAPGNDWQSSITGTTINYWFEACDNPSWGDGRLLDNNYTCASYTFCYDATLDLTCADPAGFNVQLTFTDDGVAGAGTSTPKTIYIGSGTGNCLPFSLTSLSLSAEVSGKFSRTVRLQWVYEGPAVYAFRILRSYDAEWWEPLAELSQNVLNRTFMRAFQYVDSLPGLSDPIAYRVLALLPDGSVHESNVVWVRAEDPADEEGQWGIVSVYPDRVVVTFREIPVYPVEIRVRDFSGRKVRAHVFAEPLPGGSGQILSIPPPAHSGLYILEIRHGDGQTWWEVMPVY